jgi:hypothetical protein
VNSKSYQIHVSKDVCPITPSYENYMFHSAYKEFRRDDIGDFSARLTFSWALHTVTPFIANHLLTP